MDARKSAAGAATGKPRKPKSFLQRYTSPIVFLFVVILVVAKLRSVANSGYFETHMEAVRRVAADKYIERQRGMANASSLPSGLIFSIARRGDGMRAPAADDLCDIHYHAEYRFFKTLENTREGGYPVRRSPSQFIPGVAEALQLMRPGDKWRLIVPYTLAYGLEGNKAMKIPSFVNLHYDLELLKCDDNVKGRTSEEIDKYLAPYLKTTTPSGKRAPAGSDGDL